MQVEHRPEFARMSLCFSQKKKKSYDQHSNRQPSRLDDKCLHLTTKSGPCIYILSYKGTYQIVDISEKNAAYIKSRNQPISFRVLPDSDTLKSPPHDLTNQPLKSVFKL